MIVKALREEGKIIKYDDLRGYEVTPTLTDTLTVKGIQKRYIVGSDIPTMFKMSMIRMRGSFVVSVDGGEVYTVKFYLSETEGVSVLSAKLSAQISSCAQHMVSLGDPFRVNPCHKCIAEAIRLFP